MTEELNDKLRGDPVKLARHFIEVRKGKGITSYGVLVLCEAILKMDAALTQRPAAQEVYELPGMWDHSDLSGGETDAKPPIPSFLDLMSAPHKTFASWCQGPMAHECGDLLAAAAVCRLNDARSIIQSMLTDAEGQISASTMEHVRRFLDA